LTLGKRKRPIPGALVLTGNNTPYAVIEFDLHRITGPDKGEGGKYLLPPWDLAFYKTAYFHPAYPAFRLMYPEMLYKTGMETKREKVTS
jgi:hypothetical protein